MPCYELMNEILKVIKKMSAQISRASYISRNIGDFFKEFEIDGIKYVKVDDLRYGTNPHQPAAFYKPVNYPSPVGSLEILKTGKSGLSQTNLEDISYSLNIVKFFDAPACAVMKHVNPSGAAVALKDETVREVYIKARDCDPRAAFGSTIGFNCNVDFGIAEEIMATFTECVVAPSFSDEALAVFNDSARFKLNSSIRIIKCGNLSELPKFVGQADKQHRTLKTLADGSIVIAEPLLTNLRSIDDIRVAEAENSRSGRQMSLYNPTKEQLRDLLAAWYVNINVRSNGVVIFKNGETLAVGTGEQDRVGAVEQAIEKFKQKYQGKQSIEDSVMSSDGFFPFPDAVEIAAKAGVKAIIAPAGSLSDADVIKRANELGVALTYAPERIFSHH